MELDFVCQHTLDYPAYWITISKRLSSTESLDRKFALLQIQSLSQSFNRTTSPHLLDKISLQIEKCTFDEISSIRSLSCLLLSKIISLQKTPRRSAFNAIISGLISVFPADLDSLLQTDPSCFHKFQYTPSHILHARINLIHALSGLFYCFEYLSPDIFCYIDTLFVALLNPQTNPLLQTAVIQSISSFPKTNRSRLRVEKYFRLLMFALVKSDKGQQEKQAPFHLQKAISKFASIWFPKSLDVNLIRINKTESQLDRLGNGYSKRRLEWLTKNESSKIKNLAPIKLPYTARSRAVLNPLDFSYGLQHYAHKRHAGCN